MSDIKRTGLHIRTTEETENLLKRIGHLTYATHDDILNLGCKCYLNLLQKQLIKGTPNELSGNQTQDIECILEDRNDERNVIPVEFGQPRDDRT
jgi:hypothetical protein